MDVGTMDDFTVAELKKSRTFSDDYLFTLVENYKKSKDSRCLIRGLALIVTARWDDAKG